MKIEVKYFARIREALGKSDEQLDLPSGIHTIGQLHQWLAQRGGVWSEVFAEGQYIRYAYNFQMCGPEQLLNDECEVAFFPPVTGG